MKASAGFKLGLTRTSLSDVDAYTRIVVYASLSSAHVFAIEEYRILLRKIKV